MNMRLTIAEYCTRASSSDHSSQDRALSLSSSSAFKAIISGVCPSLLALEICPRTSSALEIDWNLSRGGKYSREVSSVV